MLSSVSNSFLLANVVHLKTWKSVNISETASAPLEGRLVPLLLLCALGGGGSRWLTCSGSATYKETQTELP